MSRTARASLSARISTIAAPPDEHRESFARRAAVLIEATMGREDAVRLILAGDEVAVPRLRGELSTAAAERVRDVLRIELRHERRPVR